MRIFGVNSVTSSRTAHAQYNLPLPMGSPLNVFGDPTSKDLQGNPQNFWAAIQGPCTLKANGDPYATKDSTTVHSNCAGVSSPANPEYKAPAPGDGGAYDYSIKVPPGGGGTLSIQLYDPEFCQRNDQAHDTGDTAFSNQSSVNFDTTFTLYNQSATPYDLSDDTVNTTVTYPGDGSTSTGDGLQGKTHSCSSYYVHTDAVTGDDAAGGKGSICYPAAVGCGTANAWIQFATVAVTPGTYRVNVQTSTVGSSPADGSNMFSLKATSTAGASLQPQVFGGTVGTQSTMSIFNNLQAGTSYIYLAQIDATNAGKTLVIDLFDPGDLNGTGVMYFEQPTTTGYVDDQFTWRNSGTTLNASGTQSGTVSSVTTASGGNSNFQGNWLVVTIPIDPSYAAPQNGWWKVKYVITGGAAHDRTTWTAKVQNSPVHLVP